MKISSALTFLRDVELMSISDAPWTKGGPFGWVKEYPLDADLDLDWKATDTLDGEKVQYYRVYLGCASKRDLISHVTQSIAPGAPASIQMSDRGTSGHACMGTVSIDWKGRIVESSFKISPYVLGVHHMMSNQSLDDLPEDLDVLAKKLLDAIKTRKVNAFKNEPPMRARLAMLRMRSDEERNAGDIKKADALMAFFKILKEQELTVLDHTTSILDLSDLSAALAELIGYEKEITTRIEDVTRNWKPDQRAPYPPGADKDSFLFEELRRVAAEVSITEASQPLTTYLTGWVEPQERKNLFESDGELVSRMAADRLPAARWPSPPTVSLSLGQQIGVGHALGPEPLTAVNGPPGTGKTTLLRDIIANRVLQRAGRLLALAHPSQAIERIRVEGGDCPAIKRAFTEGAGIVVTSNSNAAVENVSHELPQAGSIDKAAYPRAAYLPDVADTIARAFEQDKADSWGLISMPMGKRSNVRRVMDALCGLHAAKGAPAEDLGAILSRPATHITRDWDSARKAHQNLLARYTEEMDRRSQSDVADYITTADITAASTNADKHLLSAWATPDLEEIRSSLFLSALELHEIVLRENAKSIGEFIAIFAQVLEGEIEVSQAELVQLWNTLFFIVPVVSTTFVSMQRFPYQAEWIGDVLVDEAGQATPQSVVPALQRAAKATIVGDPLQLEPIISSPAAVIEALRHSYNVPEYLSPAVSSVQAVADSTIQFGAWIPGPKPDQDPVWTGIPLRVHRRCAEPMFRLSNTIAYGGQMVHGADPVAMAKEYDSILGRSQWFDIRGRAASGGTHAITEELDHLETLLAELHANHYFIPDDAKVIVVTPFAQIRTQARKRAQSALGKEHAHKVQIGTIHQFQGREADIVFLVLGTQPGRRGQHSRDWAASSANMLNVAISRARKRLYIIGNHQDWRSVPHFSEVANLFSKYRSVVRP